MSRTTRSSFGVMYYKVTKDYLVRDGKTASDLGYSDFKRMLQRIARSRAKQALREGREPEREKNDYKWWWY